MCTFYLPGTLVGGAGAEGGIFSITINVGESVQGETNNSCLLQLAMEQS